LYDSQRWEHLRHLLDFNKFEYQSSCGMRGALSECCFALFGIDVELNYFLYGFGVVGLGNLLSP
jgi:hypothetical protein